MFDFSFAELMVIMLVALVAIGPERLPRVARTLGHLWGRAQRYANGIKAEIERDMAVEEFQKLQKKIQSEAGALEQAMNQTAQQLNDEVGKHAAELSHDRPSLTVYAGRNKPDPDKPE